MLKMSLLEFFVRLVPEVILFILATHVFSNTKVNNKRFICSSILFGITAFIIRFLPINYGVHTILIIISLTIIISVINKIDIIKSIKASITTAIVLFLCEGLNILLLAAFYGNDLEPIMSNATLKTLYSLPSLIGFLIIIVFCYKNLNKRGKLENVECRKDM